MTWAICNFVRVASASRGCDVKALCGLNYFGIRGRTAYSSVLPHPSPLPLGEGDVVPAPRIFPASRDVDAFRKIQHWIRKTTARIFKQRKSLSPLPAGEGQGEALIYQTAFPLPIHRQQFFESPAARTRGTRMLPGT
jgi:hypothetical protein